MMPATAHILGNVKGGGYFMVGGGDTDPFTPGSSTPLPGVGLGPKRIARDVKLGAAMLRAYHVTTGMKISNLYTSGYLRSDAYGGTNLSHVPKIFIETGNMRSPGNARKLESPAFRHLAAWGIAYGIRLYLTGHM